ncbi:exosortase H [Thiocystis minor]|uniref:exosortase H n=1 Tax=Thiocystis minor TaxID=61597 RepID=UPI00191321D5|nr:exosortase H [Thiocystis minor]MBK5963778.1 exosortase H [Thiocystis minor]
MRKFFFVFSLLVVLLFAAELLPWGQTWFVLPWTAAITDLSAWLMQTVDDQVQAQGKLIWDQASGFAVSVEAGCNGVEAAIILVAAMVAFPAPWRHKLTGILVGVATVQALNVLRIISLFYLGQWNKAVFEWAHLYVWQALIMLDVLLVFLFWLRWLSRQEQAAKPMPEGTT